MATVLGVGGSDHDVHCCIVQDDRFLCTIEEERVSRRKYGLGGNLLEGLSRQYCLDASGLTLDDIDHVVVDSILAPTAFAGLRKRAKKLDHHLAHAAAAFFTSGFDAATVVIVDNAGDLASSGGVDGLQATSWYRASGRSIELLGRVLSTEWKEGPALMGKPYQRGDGNHSLGHLYKKATGALGFKYPPSARSDPAQYYFPEDGITMGLSSYGDDRFVAELSTLVELGPDGTYAIHLNDGRMDAMLMRWLGDDPDFGTRAAVARAAQDVLERLMRHVVLHAVQAAGEPKLCLGGGVAMNTVVNGRLLDESAIEAIHVPPMPGDNGTGVGAALWQVSRDRNHPIPRYSVYGGRRYEAGEHEAAIRSIVGKHGVHRLPEAELLERIVEHLCNQKVVAWFEGGSENGRRALGHRSILADPRTSELRDYVNNVVKRRQSFRPLAPIVVAERANEFFEARQPSPFMQFVFRVRPEHKARLAGITHVDGTARVQTVERSHHRRLHELLLRFADRTSIPVLLNTSFNIAGEPIVETPSDAARCFSEHAIDVLVLDEFVVEK
jgi:carbamoyltransferase